MVQESNGAGISRTTRALVSGTAGALVLTTLHEVARRMVPHAPRMDVIGQRALSRTARAAGLRSPPGPTLFRQTLAGELISNALYYGAVGAGSRAQAWRRGLILGLAAGIGAVVLPPRMGLGDPPNQKAPLTPLLTVAWYTAGGLAAAAVAHALGREE